MATNWWEALAPQQSPAPVVNPVAQMADPTLSPASLPSGAIVDPAQAEPGLGDVSFFPFFAASRLPAVVKGGMNLARLSGLPEEQALQGELMGGLPAQAPGVAGRIGRQGQIFEGELAASNPLGLPAPMSSPAASAAPRGGQMMPDDFLAALVRQRGAGGTVDDAAAGAESAGRAAGAADDAARAAGGEAGSGGGGAWWQGGQGGPESFFRTLFPKGHVLRNSRQLSTGSRLPWSPFTPDGEGAELQPLTMPGGTGLSAELAGLSSDFSFPPDIETARQELPQVDWEGMTQVDYEKAMEVLAGLRPPEPEERSWMQDLAGWVLPAVAMGTLLGPLGLVAGGLMGEGGRQSREQQREADYQRELQDWQQGLVQNMLKLQAGQRGQELETQQGIRQQELENTEFDLTQENQDMTRTRFRNQNMLDELTGRARDVEIQRAQQGQRLQAMMMNSGIGVDNGQLLTQLVQTNPQVMAELQGMPEFAQWQAMAISKNPADQMASQAAVSALVNRLASNPRYAGVLAQLRQQMALAAMLTSQ